MKIMCPACSENEGYIPDATVRVGVDRARGRHWDWCWSSGVQQSRKHSLQISYHIKVYVTFA